MIDAITQFAQDHIYVSICICFVIGLISDYIYACYMLAVSERRPLAAANWSLIFTILWLAFTLSIIEKSIPLILAYLAGGYIGTFLATKNAKEKT